MDLHTKNHVENSMYLNAFHNTTVGMAIVNLEGKVIKSNVAVTKILGYTEEELSQVTFSDYTHPEELDSNLQLIRELLEGEREYYEIEKRFIHKNGEIVWGLLHVSLVRDDENTPLYFISQLKNITIQKRAEEKLLKMGREYELLRESSLDVITKHTPMGEYTYVSPAIQLLGYAPEELIGKSPYHYCHPDDVLLVEKYLYLLVNKLEVKYKLNFRMMAKDGQYRWLESTGKGITDAKGEVEEILAFSRDITDRKLAEEALKESEERYRSLFENHGDMIYTLDLDGYITSFNPAFKDVSGITIGELQTKLKHADLVLLQYRERTTSHFQFAKKGIVQQFEAAAENTLGKVMYVDVMNIPIIVENKVVGVYGIARDITAKKQAEIEIKLAKTQLESFIDNNVDPILIFDKAGLVVKVNDAFTSSFGWTSEEALGVYHLDLAIIPKEDKESVSRNLEIIRGGETFQGYQTKRVKKGGGTIEVDISGFPIHNSQGEVDGWAITFRDISEAKAAEEVLRNSEKLTIAGQLAAGIAHEIRNPLTAIKGFIQLLNKEFPHRKHYFEIIIEEISRIELIISELLYLAKPQEIKFITTDIHTLLKDVILLLETQAILSNVEINLDLTLKNSEINGEKNQLKQVFINFIKNSIEAMPNGGKLTIKTVDREGKGAVIDICDTGPGIPSAVLERLGEPFYTTKEKGTGLGFMISKKIIETHGGCLEVYSRENCGTTIEIFFPYQPS